MIENLSRPWPWFVAGPLIGLTVALLLLVGGRAFGVSSSLRHLCAATVPGRSPFLRYDWRGTGLWNLVFVAGVVLGGLVSGVAPGGGEAVALSEATRADLGALGVAADTGLVPKEIYGFSALASPAGLIVMVAGGFLVGFGARYAGGCTSGHAITGLASFQLPSLVAVVGFFAGGLAATHFLLPLVLGGP
ncbi:MAG: YeeE/YedE thiosulfate transporter family protein [Acidobacteriota bacterium]